MKLDLDLCQILYKSRYHSLRINDKIIIILRKKTFKAELQGLI